jgi:hypothetical protein
MARRGGTRGRARKERLREQAAEIDRERQSRGPKEQLALLDKRLGVDVGAVKERSRLARLIEVELEKKSKSSKRSTTTDRPTEEKASRGRGRDESRGERRKAKARRNRERDEKRSTKSRSSGST